VKIIHPCGGEQICLTRCLPHLIKDANIYASLEKPAPQDSQIDVSVYNSDDRETEIWDVWNTRKARGERERERERERIWVLGNGDMSGLSWDENNTQETKDGSVHKFALLSKVIAVLINPYDEDFYICK